MVTKHYAIELHADYQPEYSKVFTLIREVLAQEEEKQLQSKKCYEVKKRSKSFTLSHPVIYLNLSEVHNFNDEQSEILKQLIEQEIGSTSGNSLLQANKFYQVGEKFILLSNEIVRRKSEHHESQYRYHVLSEYIGSGVQGSVFLSSFRIILSESMLDIKEKLKVDKIQKRKAGCSAEEMRQQVNKEKEAMNAAYNKGKTSNI